MIQILADVGVPLDDKLTEGHLRLIVLMVLVLDDHRAELIGLPCLVLGEEVVLDHERVQWLLHSHHDELGAEVLMGEVVKAGRPRRVAVKD